MLMNYELNGWNESMYYTQYREITQLKYPTIAYCDICPEIVKITDVKTVSMREL